MIGNSSWPSATWKLSAPRWTVQRVVSSEAPLNSSDLALLGHWSGAPVTRTATVALLLMPGGVGRRDLRRVRPGVDVRVVRVLLRRGVGVRAGDAEVPQVGQCLTLGVGRRGVERDVERGLAGLRRGRGRDVRRRRCRGTLAVDLEPVEVEQPAGVGRVREHEEQLVRARRRVGQRRGHRRPVLPTARRGHVGRGERRAGRRVHPQLDLAAGTAGGDPEVDPVDVLEADPLERDVVAVLDEADVVATAGVGRGLLAARPDRHPRWSRGCARSTRCARPACGGCAARRRPGRSGLGRRRCPCRCRSRRST